MRKSSVDDPICAADVLCALYLIREDELGRYNLTKQEVVVAQHVLDGEGTARIAKRLYLSVSGVKYHIGNILAKTKKRNREEFCTLIRRAVATSKKTWANSNDIKRDAENHRDSSESRSGKKA